MGFGSMTFQAVTYPRMPFDPLIVCFADMAFRAVTCPFEEADSCMSSFAGISSRAATYPPVFVICLNPDFESMAFRAVTYLTEASMLGLPILQAPRFEQLLTWLAKSQEFIKVLQVWSF